MRYKFRVRVPQHHPSWFDEWGGRVVYATPSFEWMIGLSTQRALDWVMDRKYVTSKVTVSPIPIARFQEYKMLLWYATQLGERHGCKSGNEEGS